MISYEPLWKTMKKKNISQYKLIHEHDISKSLLQRLRDNETITTYTIDRLCQILECEVSDVLKFTPD